LRIDLCHGAKRRHDGLTCGETVRLDYLTDLIERHTVARFQPDVSHRSAQRDLDALDPLDFEHGHAHGVGTGHSIHSEDLQLDPSELRVRECGKQQREQHDGSDTGRRHRSQKK
jgi:hypothetical protein